jgi:hypothetical protein
LALGLATLAVAPVGFMSMFSIFQPFDDEGYFLWTLRDYLGGHPVYQLYGPFYYELMGGVFRISGLEVTTDNGRIVTLVLWVLGSLIGGIAVLALTRNLWLAVAGQFLAFHALSALTNEPMHPEGLVGFLIVALAALAAYQARAPRTSAALLGAVVVASVLVKINVGLFGAMTVAFALAASASGRWKRVLLPAMSVVMVGAPLLLMARLLNRQWVWELALVISFSAGGVAIATFKVATPAIRRRDVIWLMAGGAALAIACLAIAAVGGMRAADLLGSVMSALRLPELFVLPTIVSLPNVAWALLCMTAAAAILVARFGARTSPAIPAFFRVGIGSFTWFSVLLLPSWYFLVALPLAWVAVQPPPGDAENPTDPWARTVLAALAVMEALQVYPVAGTQQWLAALALVPVGAITFNDGLRQLRALALSRRSESWLTVSRSLPRGAVIVNVAVWALFVYLSGTGYASGRALGLPGTELMRLPPAQASALESLALATRRDCTSLITMPRMASMNLWTGRAAISPLNTDAGIWIFSLDAAQQQSIVANIRDRQGVCVVLSQAIVNFWAEGRPVPRRPLVDYIDTNFEPDATFGIYDLLVSRPATPK